MEEVTDKESDGMLAFSLVVSVELIPDFLCNFAVENAVEKLVLEGQRNLRERLLVQLFELGLLNVWEKPESVAEPST